MLTRKTLALSVAAAVLAGSAGAQTALDFKAPTAKTFLQPLELRLVLRTGDARLPQFCASSGRIACPPVVTGGAVPGGAWLPSDFGYNYPHVRVSFYVDEITNVAVANGGADVAATGLLNWLTHGSAADEEKGGVYNWTVPGPGQTYSSFGPHGSPSGLLIYDALVMNACGAFVSFPVEHEASVTESGSTIGSFEGTDNSTIDSTGYYNLSYTVRVEDASGGVSDIRVEGIVAAICSGQSSL